jgi:hypothetical protein
MAMAWMLTDHGHQTSQTMSYCLTHLDCCFLHFLIFSNLLGHIFLFATIRQNKQKYITNNTFFNWLCTILYPKGLKAYIGLGLWCLNHFQQYFSYIVVVSFICGGNQNTRRKPLTWRNSLTNFITKQHNTRQI